MKLHPLRVERELRGWSQSKVAELLGTTTRTVIRWEQGDVVPYPYYREQLCTVFGKNAQQLGLVPSSPLQDSYEDEELKPASFSEEEVLAASQQPAEILGDTDLLASRGTGRYTLHQTVVDYARALSEVSADQEQLVSTPAEEVQTHKEEVPTPENRILLHQSLCSSSSIDHRKSVPTFRPFPRLSWQLLLIVLTILLAATLVVTVIILTFNRQLFPSSMQATTNPIAMSGTSYEAEAPQNVLGAGMTVYECSACSGKIKVGDLVNGNGGEQGTLQFNNIWEPSAGKYKLTVYYVNGFKTDKSTDMRVNGVDQGQFTEPSTGNWETPATFTYTVSLRAGNNTILFQNPSGYGLNFDKIVV